MTPIQTSLKKNERFVYNKLLDKRKRTNPKFQVNNLVRTADLNKTFSKGNTTKWLYKFCKNGEIINDSISSYIIDNIKEGYNEALLKKTELSMKKKMVL